MLQLDLLPRDISKLPDGAVLLQDWLPLEQQQALLTLIRAQTAKGWYTPLMPDGTPMKHAISCLGYQWQPFFYFEPRVRVPGEVVLMAITALKDAGLDHYLPYQPDTGIVNYFPHGSSLGMHQDRSEDQVLIDAGSPIVTLSLGDTGVFRLGNIWNANAPYQDIELRSGDCLIMHGACRSAFHGITKILPNTGPAELLINSGGRISLTLRQARSNPTPRKKRQTKQPADEEEEDRSDFLRRWWQARADLPFHHAPAGSRGDRQRSQLQNPDIRFGKRTGLRTQTTGGFRQWWQQQNANAE